MPYLSEAVAACAVRVRKARVKHLEVNMSGVLRHAFRRITSLENRMAVRQMSQDSKQIEGGRKPHVSRLNKIA